MILGEIYKKFHCQLLPFFDKWTVTNNNMSKVWNNRFCDCATDPLVLLVTCLVPCGPNLVQIAAVDKATGGGKLGPCCMIY